MPPVAINYQYAQALLIQDCLQPKGVDFEVTPVDIHADGPETATALGRRLFDGELAARYGYHPAPTDRFDRQEAQRIHEQRFSGPDQLAIEECREWSYGTLPALQVSLAEQLAFSVDVSADPEVVSATRDWRTCMTQSGFDDVPASPSEMPPDELAVRWGLDDPDPSLQAPSAEEVDLATADAACRDESGFTRAAYDAEWNAQVRLVAENQAALQQAKDEAQALGTRIEEVVSMYGGEP